MSSPSSHRARLIRKRPESDEGDEQEFIASDSSLSFSSAAKRFKWTESFSPFAKKLETGTIEWLTKMAFDSNMQQSPWLQAYCIPVQFNGHNLRICSTLFPYLSSYARQLLNLSSILQPTTTAAAAVEKATVTSVPIALGNRPIVNIDMFCSSYGGRMNDKITRILFQVLFLNKNPNWYQMSMHTIMCVLDALASHDASLFAWIDIDEAVDMFVSHSKHHFSNLSDIFLQDKYHILNVFVFLTRQAYLFYKAQEQQNHDGFARLKQKISDLLDKHWFNMQRLYRNDYEDVLFSIMVALLIHTQSSSSNHVDASARDIIWNMVWEILSHAFVWNQTEKTQMKNNLFTTLDQLQSLHPLVLQRYAIDHYPYVPLLHQRHVTSLYTIHHLTQETSIYQHVMVLDESHQDYMQRYEQLKDDVNKILEKTESSNLWKQQGNQFVRHMTQVNSWMSNAVQAFFALNNRVSDAVFKQLLPMVRAMISMFKSSNEIQKDQYPMSIGFEKDNQWMRLNLWSMAEQDMVYQLVSHDETTLKDNNNNEPDIVIYRDGQQNMTITLKEVQFFILPVHPLVTSFLLSSGIWNTTLVEKNDDFYRISRLLENDATVSMLQLRPNIRWFNMYA